MKSNNHSILRLLENAVKSMFEIANTDIFSSINNFQMEISNLKLFGIPDEGLKAKQRNAAHKILQSPPEKKAPNVRILYISN